ncbi:AAA family ATPase [Streptomyces sp. NPDC006477]|uniref:AAA family ATPase n=1 Tax=Streptomyces sp. NPDC006477 TaxID=3364747 RepID=UPI0036AAFF52
MVRKASGSGSASRKIRVPKNIEPVEVEEVEEEEYDEADDLNAYVPDPEIGDRYISRRLFGGHWDVDILTYALENKKNVLLMGDTGAGKTMLSRAYAAKAGMLYYSLPCDVSIDPSALFGKIVPTEEGGFEWVDGPVTQLVRYGGVLNISEINFMPPRIAASLYPLLDSRRQLPLLGNRGEIIEAHEDLLIVADMNPQYRGTTDLNAAFKNRFPIKVPWGYDKRVESHLVKNKELLSFAEKLRAKVGTELRTPVATNMLLEFEEHESALGLDFASENFLAAFEDTERGAVKQVYDVHKGNIKKFYDDERAKAEAGSAKDRMRNAVESASDDEDEIEIMDDEFEFEMED